MSVLSSYWIIQHSLSSFSDSGRVSGPSDSGSRSTSGDTGEGDQVFCSIHSKGHISRQHKMPCVTIILNHENTLQVMQVARIIPFPLLYSPT